MCAAIANWYTSQYGTWNRTRRLQVPPFVATENNVDRTQARIPAADAIILNMNEMEDILSPTNRTALNSDANKKDDTLFGPGVGIIPAGPTWADSSSISKDEISPDVIKSWISKSKDSSMPTTTLQALVNLKRPSIKLSPLAPTEPADSLEHVQHGLEFEFDCDAPKCGIKMFVISQQDPANRMLAFESVVEGGFGRFLRYDEGAILELGQLEMANNEDHLPSSKSASVKGAIDGLKQPDLGSTTISNGSGAGVDEPTNQASTRGRKRFSHFTFRKRSGGAQQVVGPALPVVDADASNSIPTSTEPNGAVSTAEHVKTKEETGIKVVIQIEALNQEGASLSSPNVQLTYLHIIRMGAAPSEEEDRRPWMVQVAKREAKIGTHLFHLHEIYGLSSTTSTTQLPTTEHSYPPTDQAIDEQTSECLLCLSSPREVVLLPCRHLVACRECAINMVEFGAGGNLVHSEDNAAAAATGSTVATGERNNTGNGENEANETATATTVPVVPTPSRRKRKAKGWFCPVCRQPYTSLLRITATPPEKEGLVRPVIEEQNSEPEPTMPTVPEPAAGLDVRSFFPRSNFLRSLSRPASRPSTANTSNMV